MCCTRLSEIQHAKKSQKIRRLNTIAQLCPAISSQLRHVSTIGKNLLHSNTSPTSAQYGELRPTNGWDRFRSLGHPSKFQRVSCLAFVAAATLLTGDQPNFAQSLAVSWAATVCTHVWGLLPPDGILTGAILTLRPSLAFSYIDSITAQHSSSGRQPNSAAWYKEWNCGTSTEGATYIQLDGHHVGHWPTF